MDDCSRRSRGDQSEGKWMVNGVTENLFRCHGEKRMDKC